MNVTTAHKFEQVTGTNVGLGSAGGGSGDGSGFWGLVIIFGVVGFVGLFLCAISPALIIIPVLIFIALWISEGSKQKKEFDELMARVHGSKETPKVYKYDNSKW